MYINLLPIELQKTLKNYKHEHPIAYNGIFGNKHLINLDSKELMFLLCLCPNTVKKSNRFKIGDKICSDQAIKNGLFIIFEANDYDVKRYSNKGKHYYIFPNLKSLL